MSDEERRATIADFRDSGLQLDKYIAACRRCNVRPERIMLILDVLGEYLEEQKRGEK